MNYSPALSNTTGSSDTVLINTTINNTSKTPAIDYAQLFEDVNWNEVNLIDIEKEWRNELDQIEKVPGIKC